MTGLSLRKRIALFFVALAVGGVGIVGLAGVVGQARGEAGWAAAGLIAGFGILALVTGIWWLFDQNVARPIERLARDMRTRAHAEVDQAVRAEEARYLGDLGPAAEALSRKLGSETLTTAERIAAETARLEEERRQLTDVLTRIPVAVLMIGPDHRITLYDGQAATALEPVRPLCLGHEIFDYLDKAQIEKALERGGESNTVLASADGTRVFDADVRLMGDGAGYLVSLKTDPNPSAERPIVYGVGLPNRVASKEDRDAQLSELTYVIFDTETTGLRPETDAVVQIGAVRAKGARRVAHEICDMLVNPGRPIPATSTKVHGITDGMVADASPMPVAAARFRAFAEGSVLVAHNAPFDMAFLTREGGFDHPVLDTVLLGAALFGTDDHLTLDALAERLQVSLADEVRHTALGDAEATADVFLKMLPMLDAKGVRTLGDAIALQRQHARLLPDLNG